MPSANQHIFGEQSVHMGLVDIRVPGIGIEYIILCFPQVVYHPPGQARCKTSRQQQGTHYVMQTANLNTSNCPEKCSASSGKKKANL